MDIDDFKDTLPPFLPEIFLRGELEGWGIVERITGGLQRRFAVEARGTWDDMAGQLDFRETWRFDDGRSDTLAWKIRHVGDARYTGTEQRLSGEAEGEQQGCAFHWQYSRDTPLGDDTSMLLDYNDWFYRIDERVVMVRGSAGRAGLPFAILHATYRKIS